MTKEQAKAYSFDFLENQSSTIKFLKQNGDFKMRFFIQELKILTKQFNISHEDYNNLVQDFEKNFKKEVINKMFDILIPLLEKYIK